MATACFTTTEDDTQTMVVSRGREVEAPIGFVITEDNLAIVFLASLSPSQFTLRQILPIHTNEMTHGYMASFIDANIHSSGETRWEAIENLKELVVDAYQMLQEIDPSVLGPGPSKQLAILKSFIQ